MILALALFACTPDDPVDDTDPTEASVPALVVTEAELDGIRGRLDTAPFDHIYAEIVANADEELREWDPDIWDHSAHGHNAEIAQANAFLAWLDGDADRAESARSILADIPTDFETNETWDVNIRMPHVLFSMVNAVEFLDRGGYLTPDERDTFVEATTTINGAFYDRYGTGELFGAIALLPAQNNHPIRTAASIGYVAMAYPDHPDADDWANWAFSELDYLWGPDGHYVQPDGGVSEGPFYYGFAYAPSAAYFLTADRIYDQDPTFLRDCTNRNDVDPWTDHGCVDGEPFTWTNPLYEPLFRSTVDWSVSLRLPSGHRPPLADAYFNPLNGAALLGGDDNAHRLWDWEHNVDRPFQMEHGHDLTIRHLVELLPDAEVAEPDWTDRFLPDAGNAIFRSDWSTDARWLLLVAENGDARKTLHDHVDGTSFSMAAYGEYLLVDPGYYKPNSLDNARTSAPEAHNVILVDGEGAPDKGLLTDFGDTDAFLSDWVDTSTLTWATASQSYQDTDVRRGILFVDDRYWLVVDRLDTTVQEDRVHSFRLGGHAGYGVEGTFELHDDGARWERTAAGVDVYIASPTSGVVVTEPPFDAENAPHVHQFALNREVNTHGVIDASVTGSGVDFLTVLAPYQVGSSGDDGPMDVEALDLGAGVTAWQVEHAGGTDVAILREGSSVVTFALPESQTVTTDAPFAFVRLDGSEALIAGGTTLSLDGSELISGSGEILVAD